MHDLEQKNFLAHLRQEWYRPDLVRYVPEALPFEALKELSTQPANTQTPLGLLDTTHIVQYFLILNSINHQFGSLGTDNTMVRYAHEGKVGALALHSGVERLITERGFALDTPLTVQDVATYFGAMPDPDVRCRILNEAFTKSEELANNGWTVMDALTVAQTLPAGYKDEALKKAQLALYMASQALDAVGVKVDVELTVFADYQVPKVMRHLGQLEYSPELAAKIDRGELLPADSVEERVIRAATILCAEDTSGVSTGQLDYWYWLQRNDTKLPFHCTLTVAY